MRRLVQHQQITIELDAEFEGDVDALVCRVGSVHGPVATLGPVAELSDRVRERLTPGSLGFMVFRHHGTPVGLRGVVRAAPESDEVEFVVIDGIQIAEHLYLSPHTVKEHTSAVYRKLQARNRAEAVQRAQRIGLLA